MPRCVLYVAALIALAVTGLWTASAFAADPKAVARIQAGIVDCPGCNLSGANLANTCVKEKNLRGANFDGADASLMCMSFADFTNASFRGTDLGAANMAGARMDGADMTGAKTSITSFLGTDLRKVKAAQYVAAHPGEVCPAKWKEGEKTLAPSLDLVGKI